MRDELHDQNSIWNWQFRGKFILQTVRSRVNWPLTFIGHYMTNAMGKESTFQGQRFSGGKAFCMGVNYFCMGFPHPILCWTGAYSQYINQSIIIMEYLIKAYDTPCSAVALTISSFEHEVLSYYLLLSIIKKYWWFVGGMYSRDRRCKFPQIYHRSGSAIFSARNITKECQCCPYLFCIVQRKVLFCFCW